jgi:hypothetical protein
MDETPRRPGINGTCVGCECSRAVKEIDDLVQKKYKEITDKFGELKF